MSEVKLFSFPHALAGILLLLALFIGFFPPAGLSPKESQVAALTLGVIAFWSTGVIAEHLAALIFLLLAVLLSVAPTMVIFSGFASTAFWMVFAGMIIGVAVKNTGLGERVAGLIARHIDYSYLTIISGMVATGVIMAFIMPSSLGRLTILIPIAIALAGRCGYSINNNGFLGIIIATALGCHVPAFAILPSNVPNMIMLGQTETQLGITPLYGEYLLLHFPVLGLLKAGLIIVVVLWLFPENKAPKRSMPSEKKPLSSDEIRLGLILLVALGLWITDFLHHISAAWVALAAAILLLMPRIGVIPNANLNGLSYGSLFFVVGVLAMGALVADSGLGGRLGEVVLAYLPLEKGHNFQNFMALALASTFTGAVATMPSVPAIMTPMATEMAALSGVSVKAVAMTQVLGFSTILLPYHSAPLVISMQMAGLPAGKIIKPVLVIAVLSICILFPLDYLWWELLGWL